MFDIFVELFIVGQRLKLSVVSVNEVIDDLLGETHFANNLIVVN